jgi:hypothetical protein
LPNLSLIPYPLLSLYESQWQQQCHEIDRKSYFPFLLIGKNGKLYSTLLHCEDKGRKIAETKREIIFLSRVVVSVCVCAKVKACVGKVFAFQRQ